MARNDDLQEDNNPFEPRRNEALLGHEEAEKTILDAWNSKRMHHAWLLCGPRGVGKATLAYRMARFILSGGGTGGAGLFGDQPDGLYVDPEDPVARRIAGGGHGDLKVIGVFGLFQRLWVDLMEWPIPATGLGLEIWFVD